MAEQIEGHWSTNACKWAFYIAIPALAIDVVLSFYLGTFDGLTIIRVVLWVLCTYWLKSSAAKNPTNFKGGIGVALLVTVLVGAVYGLASIV